MRDEVLQDHLLQVVEAGERLQRGHPVRLGLADADQDPAGERDPQLLGGGDRGQPLLGVLGRRALVGDEVRVDRLEHQALRGGDRAQPGEVVAAEDAEVRVRQHAALERPLARPDDVGGEVLEAERVQPLADAGVVVGRLAGEHEQLLDATAGGAVDQPLDLGGLLQVRLVRRERAVLAVAAARARQRQRQVAGERDAAAHRAGRYRCRHHVRPCSLARLICAVALAFAGCGGTTGNDRPDEEATLLLDFAPNGVHAGIYVATSRGFDDAEGVELEVRAPGASTDALRQLQAGRADMAILDIHDLALAREKGRDIVGVMALLQRPLASVQAQPEVRRPRDLEGRRVGVTGLPSDVAVLDRWSRATAAIPQRCGPRRSGSRRCGRCSPSASTPRRRSGTSRAWRCASGGRPRRSSASTTSAPPRTRSWCSASPGRRSTSGARSSRATVRALQRGYTRPRTTRRARRPRCRRRHRARPRSRRGAARRRRPRLHRRRPRLRRAARGHPARVGGLGPRVRDRPAPDRRRRAFDLTFAAP